MNGIAKATGVSKGGLYHYFQTKEQLLYLIMQRYVSRMLAGLTSDLAEIESPTNRVKFLVSRHVKLYVNNIYESRLMFHDMHLLPDNLFKIMIKKSREYRKIWTETVLTLCQGSGFSDTQITLATLSLLGMSNWIYLWYNPRGPIDEEQLVDHICDVFLGRFGQQICPV
jgi:TetR/AcrR family transcriptional regulator, cholesterol catabolism regulator